VELHGVAFSEGRPRPGLEPFLENVLFRHPWHDERSPSLAYVDPDGRLIGCLGVMPRPMTYLGVPIRVLSANNFIVHPDHRRGFAAIELLRTLLRYDADLIVSEATGPARKIDEALGGRVVTARSRRWLRILRPTALAVHLAAESRLGSRTAQVLSAMAAVPDAMTARLPGLRIGGGRLEAERDLDGPLLADLVERLTGQHTLRPIYTAESATWLLASLRRSHRDQTLRARAVASGGDVVGWYIYYSRPAGIGRVLHMGATDEARPLVLRHLLADARGRGNTGLSGSSDPRWTEDLLSARCVFREGSSWLVGFASDEALFETLESPRAFMGRLEGEGWLRFAA
jgi:hypothetical protein